MLVFLLPKKLICAELHFHQVHFIAGHSTFTALALSQLQLQNQRFACRVFLSLPVAPSVKDEIDGATRRLGISFIERENNFVQSQIQSQHPSQKRNSNSYNHDHRVGILNQASAYGCDEPYSHMQSFVSPT